VLLLVSLACTGPSEERPPPSSTGTDTDTDLPLPDPPPVGSPFLQFVGDRPTNVLMISIDTTRRDHVAGFAPDGAIYTPFLRELASSGVQLEDHQQCSNWTFASTSCTLGGRYSVDAGFMPKLVGDDAQVLPTGQKSLAWRLGEEGWYSILVSPNKWLSTRRNNAQGYDEAPTISFGGTTRLLDAGIEYLGTAMAANPSPWMLHVHVMEPHPPYVPPEAYRAEANALPPLPDTIDLDTQGGQYSANNGWPTMPEDERELLEAHLRARYRGELRYLDDQLRSVWTTLDADGWLDDTLVVIWTDHGEQFWEHGNQAHAYFLGAEENDAVLTFWAKNIVPNTWSGPTHAVDLVPTVLDAVGRPADPEDPELSGYVLGTAPDDRPRFAESIARLGVVQTVTLDGWKLSFNFAGVVRLYDRNTDRYETTDLYAPDHPRVADLWALLRPRIEAMHALEPTRPLTWPEGLPQP
jgi:arylsulfatase A-like enzyme